MPIPSTCLTAEFTSGPLGELTLNNTAQAPCPWPLGQYSSCNALRYDPAKGLWAFPPGLPQPPTSTSLVPVILSSQGGTYTSSIDLPAGSGLGAVREPAATDPAFTTGPATALNPVTVTNPSASMPMGFVGWAEWYGNMVDNSSTWLELWGALWYPGSAWPNVQGNWDAIRSSAPRGTGTFAAWNVRRGVVMTLAAGASGVVSARLGFKNVAQSGGTDPLIIGWQWRLFGAAFMLDAVAQG